MENQTKLTVTFVEKVYSTGKCRTLISSTKTDNKFEFYGRNKSDCRQQAKENYRNGVEWIQEWE
jgi:hypothetical protein